MPSIPTGWGTVAMLAGAAVLVRIVVSLNGPPSRPSGRVVGVTGFMGSGKTLYCVREIRRRLKRGQHVASNFTLDLPDKWRHLWHPLSCWEDIARLRNVCIFIDEVQLWAPASRTYNMPGHVRWLLSHARKHRQDIYWITQSEMRVTTGVREQTSELVRCSKFLLWHRARAFPPELIGKKKQKPLWSTWYYPTKKLRTLYRTLEPMLPDKSVDPDGIVAGLMYGGERPDAPSWGLKLVPPVEPEAEPKVRKPRKKGTA